MPYANRDVRANDILTAYSVAYEQDASGFAYKAFGQVPLDTEEKTGRYYSFDLADKFRSDARERAPGTASARKEFSISTKTYALKRWAVHTLLADEDRSTKSSPLDDQTEAEYITEDLMIRRETDFHTAYLTPTSGVWSTYRAGVAASPTSSEFVQWNQASPTIINDLNNWSRTVKLTCGKRPNVCIMTSDVWDVVRNDSNVLSRHQYVSDTPLDLTWFAGQISVDEVIISDAIYNSANEGAAAAMSFMATERVFLGVRDERTSKKVMTAGRTFAWSPYDNVRDLVGTAAGIESWYDRDLKADKFEGESYYQHAVVAAAAGLVAHNVLV